MSNPWNFVAGQQIGNESQVYGGKKIPHELGDIICMDPEFTGKAAWLSALQIYQGGPVPRILNQQDNFYLIERIKPVGLQIKEAIESGHDSIATELQAAIASRLHAMVPSDFERSQFLTADEYFHPVRVKLEHGLVPPDLQDHFSMAIRLHNHLEAIPSDQKTVLHYHIHYQNAQLTNNGSVAINPTGVIGHPAREAAAWLYNPNGVVVDGDEVPFKKGRLVEQAQITADTTGWNKDLILSYTFIRAVENCARRLDGTPQGQVDINYWRRFIGVVVSI